MTADELTRLYERRFSTVPRFAATAPGRVNLIGEHTDYNGGFVFPVAIDRQVYVAAEFAEDTTVLVSEQAGYGESFDAPATVPGGVSGWASYAGGMAWVLREHTGVPMPNIRGVVASTVPMGSGVSSSAAIELAFGVLWNSMANLGLDNKTLALLGQRCENLYVGVNCGIMDQMASAMGRRGQAMFLDTRTLEIGYAPIPEDLSIVICDTKKPRALTDSAYNERRSQCEAAARSLGVPQLRDATLETLEARRSDLEETVFRRAKHVIGENARCVAFHSALNGGDRRQVGELMRESHESLRDDYEVSCAELDAMAEACWDAPGCVGARMTGAGFGGVCVALVERTKLDAFSAKAAEAYRARTGIIGAWTPCSAVEGAHLFGV